jgi:hypothetical protein
MPSKSYCGEGKTSPLEAMLLILLLPSLAAIFYGLYSLLYSVKYWGLRLIIATVLGIIFIIAWFITAWSIGVEKCGIMPGGY